MQPREGPLVYRVTALTDALIGAGLTLGPIEFQFPRSVFVTGISILPTSGLRADMAKLSVRIEDETFQDIIADGAGEHFGSVLSLMGTTVIAPLFADLVLHRPFKLQRPVRSGDTWRISIRNRGLVGLRTETLLYFDEGEEP